MPQGRLPRKVECYELKIRIEIKMVDDGGKRAFCLFKGTNPPDKKLDVDGTTTLPIKNRTSMGLPPAQLESSVRVDVACHH